MTFRIMIDRLPSKKAAEYLKAEIVKYYPLTEGLVRIVEEPDIMPLSEIIKQIESK